MTAIMLSRFIVLLLISNFDDRNLGLSTEETYD